MDLKTFTAQVRDGYQLAVIAQQLQQLHNAQQAILEQQAQALALQQQHRLQDNRLNAQQLAELTQARDELQQHLKYSQHQAQYWQQLFAQLEKMHQTGEGIQQLLQPLPAIIDTLTTQPWPTPPAGLTQSPPVTQKLQSQYVPQALEERAFDGNFLAELANALTASDDSVRLYKSIKDLLNQTSPAQTPTDPAQLNPVMERFYQNAATLADKLEYSQKDILLTQKKLMQLGLDFQDPQSQQELKHLIVQAQALRLNPADLIDHWSSLRPIIAHSDQRQENEQSRAQYFDFISYTHKAAGIDVNVLNHTLRKLQALAPNNNLLASGEAYDLISMSSRLPLASNQFTPVTEHLYQAFHNEQQRATLRDQGVPETALTSFSAFAQHLNTLNAQGQTDRAFNQLSTLLPASLLKAVQPQAILTALPNYQQDYQGATERYAASERDSISNDTRVLIRALENAIINQGEHATAQAVITYGTSLAVGFYGLLKVLPKLVGAVAVFKSALMKVKNFIAPVFNNALAKIKDIAGPVFNKIATKAKGLTGSKLTRSARSPTLRANRALPAPNRLPALPAPNALPTLPALKDKALNTKGLKHLGPLGRVANLATTLPVIHQALQQPLTQDSSRMLGQEAGGLAGGMAGFALGASIGSIIPGLGTAVGGLVGGLIGSMMGESAGESLGEYAWETSKQADASDTTQDTTAANKTQGLNPLGLNSVALPASLYPPKSLTEAPLTPAAPAATATAAQQRTAPASTFAPVLNLSVHGDPDPKTLERLKNDCERWLSQQLQQLSQGSGMEFYDAYN